jgi:hypothetical protein
MGDFSTEEKSNLLIKKYFGKASTNNATPFFQENPIYNSRKAVFNDQIWTLSANIPATAPYGGTSDLTGTDDQSNTLDGSVVGKAYSSIVKKYIRIQLQEVPGSSGNAYYYPDSGNNNASLLKNAIPFDYDASGGTYEYKLYKNDDTVINFGEGEWILDNDTGIVTFYDLAGVSGVSSGSPPKISFFKYIGTFGGGSSGNTSGSITSTGLLEMTGTTGVSISNSTSGSISVVNSNGDIYFNSGSLTQLNFVDGSMTATNLFTLDGTHVAISATNSLSLTGLDNLVFKGSITDINTNTINFAGIGTSSLTVNYLNDKTTFNGNDIDIFAKDCRHYGNNFIIDSSVTSIYSSGIGSSSILIENKHLSGGITMIAQNESIHMSSSNDCVIGVANNCSVTSGFINLVSTNTASNSIRIHASDVAGGILLKSGTTGINLDSVGGQILAKTTEATYNSIELESTLGGIHLKSQDDILIESLSENANVRINSGTQGDIYLLGDTHFLSKSSGEGNVLSSGGSVSTASFNNTTSYSVGEPDNSAYTLDEDGNYPQFNTSTFSISSITKISNAFMNLDNWIYKNIVDVPPKFTSGSFTTDNSKITLTWDLPTRVEVGALNIKVPYISTVKVDYKNDIDPWVAGSFTTIDLTNADASSLILNGGSGSNNYSGGIYNYYDFGTGNKDFRVYGTNDNSGTSKYLYFNDVSIGVVGVPTEVNGLVSTLTASNLSSSVTFYWTPPTDYDDSKTGIQSYPPISSYKTNVQATSSDRYGGVITQVISSVTSGSIINISGLNPGTTFKVDVNAKNSINSTGGSLTDGYGSITSINITSGTPSKPPLLNTLNVYNNSSVKSGVYIGSITDAVNVLNVNQIGSLTLFDVQSNAFALNNTVGVTGGGGSITELKLEDVASSNGSYTDLYLDVGGFDGTRGALSTSNPRFTLDITENKDYYDTTPTQGFYLNGKISFGIRNMDYYYAPRIDKHTFKLTQKIESSDYDMGNFDFYVDDVTSVPIITNYRISEIDISGSNYNYVSGLLMPSTSATLKFNVDFDKLYGYYAMGTILDYKITCQNVANGSIVDLTSTQNVGISQFDGSTHSFYTSTGSHTISSTKIQDGYTLLRSDANVVRQINDFTCSFDAVLSDNYYASDITLKMTSYNLYGSSDVELIYRDDGGTSKKIFVDLLSSAYFTTYLTDNNSNIYGKKVRSGSDDTTSHYPSGPGTGTDDFGGTYSNSVSLLSTSPNYGKELLLANGKHVTPGATYGYYNYASLYAVPVGLGSSYDYPDYSTIAANSNYRYVTFEYVGVISSAKGCRLELQNFENLSSSVTDSNMSIHIKINNSGTTSNNTGWLDANAPFDIGVNSFSKTVNGTKCLSVFKTYKSTNVLKYCYLDNPTTGDLYVKIGVKLNSTIKVGNVKITNNLV